jgi:DNA mismatch repair protein MutL
MHQAPFNVDESKLVQLFNSYILLPKAGSFLLIQQQAAHERIIYERLLKALQGKPVATQSSLFPATIELTPGDVVMLNELLPDLHQMGYIIEPFGKAAFVIQGTPADVDAGNEKATLEKILEQYKHFSTELKLSKRELLLRTVSWQQAVKSGTLLNEKEMHRLITDLFMCQQPNASPTGRPVYIELTKEQMDKMFFR